MLYKSTIAAGAIAVAAMAFQAAPAQADGVTFSFGSNGSVGVTIGDGNSGHNNRRSSGLLSCGEVESILYYDHGFRNIRATDCNGSSYKFNALHFGNPVQVRADAYSGDVIRVRPR